MSARVRARLLTATSLLVAVGCGGGEGGSTGPEVTPVTPALVVLTPTVVPSGVVVARVNGTALPGGTLGATLGGAAVTATRMDDSTLAFEVPAASATGTQALVVTSSAGALGGTVQVRAATAIANPDAYVDALLDGVDATLAQLDARLADADLAATAGDSAAMRADAQRMRDTLAFARQRYAALSAENRARVAALVSARTAALQAPPTLSLRAQRSAPLDLARTAAAVDGACQDADGNTYDTYEECSALFDTFTNDVIADLVLAAGLTAVIYIEAGTGFGIVAAIVTSAIVYNRMIDIQQATVKRFIAPVFGKLSDDEAFEMRVDAAVATTSGPLGAISTRGAVAVPPTEYFVKDTTRRLRVLAEYRSISTQDAVVPTGARFVRSGRKLEALLGGIRRALLLSPAPVLVPATPRRRVVKPVPARYLTVASIAPASVTGGRVGTPAGSDSSLALRFTRAGLTGDQPFSFDLNYAAPGLPVQTREVSAVLIPTPRFIAKSLASGGGGFHTCAVAVTDAVYCWGSNNVGELGDGTRTARLRPVPFGMSLAGVSTSSSTTCGLTSGGAVYCTELTGPTGSQPSITRVAPNHAFAAFAGNRFFGCGLSGGIVRCDGRVTADNLQNDSTYVFTTPVPSAVSFAKVYAGGQFGCALTPAGEAYCWGQNRHGQVGTNSGFFTRAATRIPGGHVFTAVALGTEHACGLKSTGQIWCWGSGAYNATGPNTTSSYNATPLVIPGYTFTHVAAAGSLSCGIAADTKTYCWGNGSGLGTTWTPTHVSGSVAFVELSVGLQHSCGRTAAGALYCWGASGAGNLLGTGTTTDHYTPAPVTTP